MKMSFRTLIRRSYVSQVTNRQRAVPDLVRTLSTVSQNTISTPFGTMPPHHEAATRQLQTFDLPHEVTTTEENRAIGKAMIDAWRADGILQIKMTQTQGDKLRSCFKASKDFFKLPAEVKAKHVDDHSFAGYIASGEELTDGIADYSEIFTVTKDLPYSDPRVQEKWPCHGPCPWPNNLYEHHMKQLMTLLGESGERILRLTALGLGLSNPNAFTDMTKDGWHHMRILRFPQVDNTNGKGKTGRGIGSHTDYGLLVIAGQDNVGGLFVRPRVEGENIKNWQSSAAGLNENDNKWLYVQPVENVLTVFPGKLHITGIFGFLTSWQRVGDMMQYVTNDYLPSTPHKVGLNTRERYAFAYFHEPNFNSVVKPVPELQDGIHYGTHFTNMFMRNYPERITAKRIQAENRMGILEELKNAAVTLQPGNILT